MRFHVLRLLTSMLLIGLCAWSFPALAEEEGEAGKPSTARVVKRAFRPELTLDGRLAPSDAEQVRIRLEEFAGPLVVDSIIEEGRRVEEGDVLLIIDTEPIDRMIEEAKLHCETAGLALERGKEQMKIDEESSQQAIEQTEIALENADENEKNYVEIRWPLEKERSELGIRRQEAWLEDQQAELAELEKMYEESELAGRTKEIVLERARRDVELSMRSLEISRKDRAFSEEKEHPRSIRDLANAKKWARQNLEFVLRRTEFSLADAEQSLKWKELEFEKQKRRLEGLAAERESLVVKATAPGLVVHGDLVKRLAEGQTAGISPVYATREGDAVHADQVILTRFCGEKYHVMVAIEERSWALVKPGMEAVVRVGAFPGREFSGQVSRVAGLPDGVGGGVVTFSADIAVESADGLFRPGLTCRAEVILADVEGALVIPAGAVSEQNGRSFCHVREGETDAKREIFIGGRGGDEVWVVSGLEEGEEVVLGQ